jgi:hypothetical protein
MQRRQLVCRCLTAGMKEKSGTTSSGFDEFEK